MFDHIWFWEISNVYHINLTCFLNTDEVSLANEDGFLENKRLSEGDYYKGSSYLALIS